MQATTLPPTKNQTTRRDRRRGTAVFALFALLPLVAPPLTAPARAAAGAPPRREPLGTLPGDVLRLFDNARVCVVTNDDPALADILLEGAAPRERRVLTPDEWRALPEGASDYFSVVFLINREKLPAGQVFPEKCEPADDELWTQTVRRGREWGVAYDVTLSAPDGAWLRRAVADFRRLKAAPRRSEAQRMAVASLAVVPVGAGAEEAAKPLLRAARTAGGLERPAHVVAPGEVEGRAGRLENIDEVVLIDRGSVRPGESLPAPVAAAVGGRLVGQNDTVAWREKKAGGRSRVVITAPTAGMLADALRRYPDPLAVPEEPTTLSTARDLRQVRRIAVASVKGGAGEELARRMAGRVASEVRALDSFEVLERSGLTEVLGEIALGQAGITRAADRARVRQLAAADALLIVEVTGVTGRTEYAARHERLTPKLGGPPPRPAQPSRLRYDISLPGKEGDPIARALTDAVLSRVVGTKSRWDYDDSKRSYEENLLPEYERRRADYEDQVKNRAVSWKQNLVARSGVTVTGSLRLVDLTDGLVLWEAPFSASERDEQPAGARTVTTYGENSRPGDGDCPASTEDVPEALKLQACETGVCDAIAALKTSALLPPPASAVLAVAADGSDPAPVVVAAAPEAASDAGRILDVDGPLVLVGLGATDGVALGDILNVSLPGPAGKPGPTVRLKVTRVRPRTCDATFVSGTAPAARAKVAAGMEAKKQVGATAPPPPAATGPGAVVSKR